MDYRSLSLDQVRAALRQVPADVRRQFGTLDATELNWSTEAAAWSIGQCLDHLAQANREMLGAMMSALDPAYPVSLWQRLPGWPGLCGRLMVSSQTPSGRRKFKAPRTARPASSDIDAAVVGRFVRTHDEVRALAERLTRADAARIVMVSPFVHVVTYSLLDALRLIVAHEHRHVQQAGRVMAAPGFPRRPGPA